MHQRTLYALIGIVILAISALLVDAAGTLGDFTVFGHGAKISQGLDLTGGLRVLLQAKDPKEATSARMTAALDIITKRVNAFGVSEPSVSQVGNDMIDVEVPDVKDPTQLRDTLGSTGELVIYGMGSLPIMYAGQPFTMTVTKLCNGPNFPTPCIVAKGSELDASQIGVSYDQSAAPQVNFGVKGAAVGRLAAYTSANAGGLAHMAIVLDGKVVTDPTTQ